MDSETYDIFADSIGFFKQLSPAQREQLLSGTVLNKYGRGTLIAGSSSECRGLIILKSGQIRAFIVSDEGKEITLYRLIPGDVCIMSASCLAKGISFEISLSFEKDSEILLVSPDIIERLRKENPAVDSYILDIISQRFSEVMWVLEKAVFSTMLARLCEFLIDYAALEGSDVLKLTHADIANNLGTAREVVTRLLKYIQNEGAIKQARGEIHIMDRKKLFSYKK